MKTYDTYKDSGIEWIGEIPKHWEVKKLKYGVNLTMGQSPSSKDCNSKKVGIPFLQGNAEFGKVYPSPSNWTEKPTKVIQKKSILVSVRAPIGAVNIANAAYCIGRGLCALSSSNYGFLYYLAIGLNKELNSYGTGSTFKAISLEQFSNVYIPFPLPTEQTAIANYLDRKTTQIDQVIADKKRLVELYQEEKTAIINQAVTKGINPDVKLKDSGIEWLGEIPKHWEVKKLRFLCKITTGDKDTENREDDAQYPFFVRSQTVERISSYSFNGEAILTAGDGVGVCKVWHYINGKFDFHQRVYMMHDFQEISGALLFQFLKQNFVHEVLKKSAKSTVDSLRRPMFLDFPVAFAANRTEQVAIVHYIEKETTRINAKIAKAKKYIRLLSEYRTALISEVVTGKVKVVD